MRTRTPDQALASGHRRRFAAILGAVGWIWACTASVYLLVASHGAGIWNASMFVGVDVDVRHLLPSLTTATGVWITALLAGVTLVAGIPLGVALTHPPDQRRVTWTAALLVLGFSLVAKPSLGLAYLPSAVLLIATAVAGDLEAAPVRGEGTG